MNDKNKKENVLKEELQELVRQAKHSTATVISGVGGDALANEAIAKLLALLIEQLERQSKSQDRLAKAEVFLGFVAVFLVIVQIIITFS